MSDREGIGAICCAVAGMLVFLVLLILLCTIVPLPVPGMLAHRVENGTLYTLDLDEGTSTLTYNLSAVFSFRKGASLDFWKLRFGEVTVALLYGGQKLGADTSLPTFQLRPWQTATVPLYVRGRQLAGAAVASAGEEDAARGYYTIEAKVHLRALDHRWCDSSCMLSFLAPTSLRGGPFMFDGEDCKVECKQRGIFML